MRLSDKVQTYVGEGDDLYAYVPGGGMGTIVRPTHNGKESGAYVAGEVHSSPTGIVGVSRLGGLQQFASPCANCILLFVHCDFKNVSAATHTFNPLQIDLGGKSGTLVAAGSEGSYVFAKDYATWDKLRKLPEINTGGVFKSGDTWPFNYVFGVSKDASVWKLMYHGIQIAELKPEKK